MENESAIKMWHAFITEHPEVKADFDAWSFGQHRKWPMT